MKQLSMKYCYQIVNFVENDCRDNVMEAIKRVDVVGKTDAELIDYVLQSRGDKKYFLSIFFLFFPFLICHILISETPSFSRVSFSQ